MPKSDKLTMKQAKFVKEYIANGGNGTQAALKAYDTDKYETANAIAVENLQKPLVMEALMRSAKKLGITEDMIMLPVQKALVATDKEGNDDLDMQLKGHDRIVKLINGKENGVSLNIESATGIEISFKNLGGSNDTPSSNA